MGNEQGKVNQDTFLCSLLTPLFSPGIAAANCLKIQKYFAFSFEIRDAGMIFYTGCGTDGEMVMAGIYLYLNGDIFS
ncbi:MAG: hypothetical protein Fur0025_04120 [Oscillatoriaceae cyanobacterium]